LEVDFFLAGVVFPRRAAELFFLAVFDWRLVGFAIYQPEEWS
jgi:hypothetical protein